TTASPFGSMPRIRCSSSTRGNQQTFVLSKHYKPAIRSPYSGSTGKPKGVLHTVAGYMVYAATTFKYVFNYFPNDVFFCTADLGWITGHTVNVYGSLANAATVVLFEGTPFYPHPGRLWEIVDKLQVTIFYTAPTAIRSLMKYGDEVVSKYSLD